MTMTAPEAPITKKHWRYYLGLYGMIFAALSEVFALVTQRWEAAGTIAITGAIFYSVWRHYRSPASKA